MVSCILNFISLVLLLMETTLVDDQGGESVSLITVTEDFVAIILNGEELATVNSAGGTIAFFIFVGLDMYIQKMVQVPLRAC